jgi:hypothetical protein
VEAEGGGGGGEAAPAVIHAAATAGAQWMRLAFHFFLLIIPTEFQLN